MSAHEFVRRYVRPGFQISRYYLGRYIVISGICVHLIWAILLGLDTRSANATPVSVIYTICDHSRIMAISAMVAVSLSAIVFLHHRANKVGFAPHIFFWLLPQHFLLCCSAGAGIYCAIVGHYADGVQRSFFHIIADQLPVVTLAGLYTVAMLYSRHQPELNENVSPNS